MDRIQELDKKPWISRRPTNLKQLILDRQHSDILSLDLDESEHKDHAEHSLLSEELEKFVSSNATEVKPYFMFNLRNEKTLIDERDCKLKMFGLQLEHAKRMISGDRAYKVGYLSKLRSTRRELLMRHLAAANRSPLSEYYEDPQDDHHDFSSTPLANPKLSTIVVIQLWAQPHRSLKVRLEKEVLFRADQCLTELRDQFKCPRDYAVPMDLGDNPEQAERIFRGELFKSGTFLIGDTFYNDMRDPNNKDLSTNIVEWAARQILIRGEHGENARIGRGIGPFKRVKMEESKFEDLEFRLGCPYLYLHQGDCEHLFTISDIRYVPNDTNFRQIRFPFVTAVSIGSKADNLRCFMCKNRPPHWYTRNNARLPVDPCFFCETCFLSFNYDESKKKIGDFQAYLYTSALDIPDSVVMASNEEPL